MFPLSSNTILGIRVSFVVVPISAVLVSWFIRDRTGDFQIQNKTQEIDGSPLKLIRIDPVQVRKKSTIVVLILAIFLITRFVVIVFLILSCSPKIRLYLVSSFFSRVHICIG